jgi:hypothetical protein
MGGAMTNAPLGGKSVVAVDAQQGQMMGHSPFEDASLHVWVGQTAVVPKLREL